jgi:hypothetical protein
VKVSHCGAKCNDTKEKQLDKGCQIRRFASAREAVTTKPADAAMAMTSRVPRVGWQRVAEAHAERLPHGHRAVAVREQDRLAVAEAPGRADGHDVPVAVGVQVFRLGRHA